MGVLWITYAWSDNDSGDFDYLVTKLADVGVEAQYDKVALIPGLRLWEQIEGQILSEQTAAWAILLTPSSLASEPCREELAIALDRALRSGATFPLIGLLHDIGIDDVPAVLRTRLCVDLRDPNWAELVKAGVAQRAPAQGPSATGGEKIVALHTPFQGNASVAAVEFRPRFRELPDWVFVVSEKVQVQAWGTGPAGGGPLSMTQVLRSADVSRGEFRGKEYGGIQPISPAVSAYLVVAVCELPFMAFVGTSCDGGAEGKWFRIDAGAITLVQAPT